MAQEIPDMLTPATVAEVYAALSRAWLRRFEQEALRASLLVLMAQWAEEDGIGRAMHRYNLGNMKHVDGDGRDWCSFRCNEVLLRSDGTHHTVWYDPPAKECRFRAFATLDAGADDFIETLVHRFASAWPAVLAGDPRDFARRLKSAHYYTADEDKYERALVSLDAQIGRLTAPALPSVIEIGTELTTTTIVNLRATPSTEHTALALVPANEKVKTWGGNEAIDGFWPCAWSNTNGWIFGAYLRI